MEFTKDIYFDNTLMNGKTATITYAGQLFKNGANQVNLVSGFGENWDNTSTIPMTKTDDGFVAEIEIKDYDTFNFCFSDENNNWDNNNYFNYISPILPDLNENTNEATETNFDFQFDSLEEFMKMVPEKDALEDIDFGTDYSASIDDIIEDILGNTTQNTMLEEESIDDILDSITQEELPEMEELFTELFLEDEKSESKENVQEIVEEPAIISTETENAELINLFNELFNEEDTTFFEKHEFKASAFNLDGLVAEILEPVMAKPVTITEEASLLDNIGENTISEETSLVTVDNDLQVSSRRLGGFYKFKKQVSIALYKLFVKTPKEIAKQLGFNID